ncbi:DUF4129 domain-containing protein [Halomontanus rarus]|uniref:DUF4129 domain-containing protein n=1 Tax=Halomontanus rarus TaxID=3034020 RepID=UPI00293BDB44|nr:DUF4129 domain-containing protein [Halovivax sp. KZCA124]
MFLDRSHITALLLTVFALTVLGVAAGTLDSAQPNDAYTFGDGEPTSGGQDAAQSQPPTDDSSSGHFLLPELNITNNLQDEQAQSGGVLTRLVLGVFLLFFGAGLVLWRLTSDGSPADIAADDEIDTLVDERTPYTPSPDAWNVPATNDVYRAWQAMIAALDVEMVDNKTPAELAEAAIKAGFPASKVSTLTEVFCNVRYGGESPTNKQEQHAQEAIEGIRQAAQLDDPNQFDSPSEL